MAAAKSLEGFGDAVLAGLGVEGVMYAGEGDGGSMSMPLWAAAADTTGTGGTPKLLHRCSLCQLSMRLEAGYLCQNIPQCKATTTSPRYVNRTAA